MNSSPVAWKWIDKKSGGWKIGHAIEIVGLYVAQMDGDLLMREWFSGDIVAVYSRDCSRYIPCPEVPQ